MATTKMTNKTALEIALTMVLESTHPEKADVAEKLQKQIASLDKKKSSPSKAQTAKQTANLGLGEMVVEFLRNDPNRMVTITEMLKEIPGLPAEITNQKLTSILRLESVKPFYIREMVKGKAMFKYNASAEVVEEED